MADIEPFTISIPDSDIADLKTRLSLARFPNELDSAAWDYGAPLADVQRLTSYWKDKFDWRRAEQKLNALPNFRTTITVQGFEPLKIHFLHRRSPVANAVPLLFVHGWPGSFIEVTKMLDELALASSSRPESTGSKITAAAPAFHIVAPSLPNFGFSEGPTRKGFAITQYAEACHKLMLQLGYSEYATQGGDWGYYITRAISLHYPAHCKATHVNFDQGEAPSLLRHPTLAIQHALTPYTPAEKAGLQRTTWFLRESSGYRAQQATRPQTLGYSLQDSPVGLLAWVYEKLHDWSDAYPWTDDEVCTWVSIYWFSTAGPAASLRIYYESTHEWDDAARRVTRDRTREYIGGGVKLGLTHAPREVRVLPATWTRTQGDVVFERGHDKGGHFFAWERPDDLIADLRDMFGKNGGAYNVVKGKDGY
jgi:pimeloyl-ACP methyl ester carboxylesterase